MGWRTWINGGAIAGALLCAFAAGALTGRLMLRDELANAAEPERRAPFASEATLVAANAEAAPGLELAGGKPADIQVAPETVQLAAAADALPSGKPEAADAPGEDYAGWTEEPEPSGKTDDV